MYGITLGMSVSAAERVLAANTSGLSDVSLPPGALRIEHVFYDCSSLKTILVMRAPATTASGYRTRFGPQLAPPAGTCTDIDRVRLADGHVLVTYLAARPGDPSSQVVARVELVEAALTSHALAIEKIPVHYYEHLAIERYGEPTYRDAFRAHKNIDAGWAIYPVGSDVPAFRALCNGTKCTEHPGWLAWCPPDVTPPACSRPTGIPDDLMLDSAAPIHDQPMHYELAFMPRPIRANTYTPGTAAYRDDIAYQERQNKRDEKRLNEEWMAAPYQLDPVANAPDRRLVERFYKSSGDQQEIDTPFVLFILEDVALYRKSFPTKVSVPRPVATPSF